MYVYATIIISPYYYKNFMKKTFTYCMHKWNKVGICAYHLTQPCRKQSGRLYPKGFTHQFVSNLYFVATQNVATASDFKHACNNGKKSPALTLHRLVYPYAVVHDLGQMTHKMNAHNSYTVHACTFTLSLLLRRLAFLHIAEKHGNQGKKVIVCLLSSQLYYHTNSYMVT